MKASKFVGATFAWLLTASSALAGGDERSNQYFEPFDPEPIINGCWAQSDDLRSAGSAALYGDGLNITHACMEEAVLTQIDAWLLPEFTKNAEAHLHALRELHGDLYYRIYAQNRHCSRSCGLLPGMRYIESYVQFLETILRDIAAEKSFRYR